MCVLLIVSESSNTSNKQNKVLDLHTANIKKLANKLKRQQKINTRQEEELSLYKSAIASVGKYINCGL